MDFNIFLAIAISLLVIIKGVEFILEIKRSTGKMKKYNLYIISAFKTKKGGYMVKGYTEDVNNVEYKNLAEFIIDDNCNNEDLLEIVKNWNDRDDDIPMLCVKGIYANYRFYLAD